MYIRMRLYRVHDYDLYILHCTKDINLQKVVISALRAYARREEFKFHVDHVDALKNKPKNSIPISVGLSKKKDQDLIDLLADVNPRMRNSFIKTITRASLEGIESIYIKKEAQNKYKSKIKQNNIQPEAVEEKETEQKEEQKIDIKQKNKNKQHKPHKEHKKDVGVIKDDVVTKIENTDDDTDDNNEAEPNVFDMVEIF